MPAPEIAGRAARRAAALALLTTLGACESLPQIDLSDLLGPTTSEPARSPNEKDAAAYAAPEIVNVPDAEGRPILHRVIVPVSKPAPDDPLPPLESAPISDDPAPVPGDLEALKRLDAPVIEATFGRPALKRREPNATLWRYGNDTCALMIYFGPDGGQPAHASIRWLADQGRDGDCLATLAAR